MTLTMERPGTSAPALILPRFGTPRNLARPTYGPEVGEVARRLGKPLMPWQQYAVDVALEYDPDTGDLYYEEVDLTVPRQSGKTTLILALMVWRSITMARRLGPQTTTYLAQSGKMARRKLEREFIPIMRRSRSLHEVPHNRARPKKPNEFKPSMNNGSEHVLFGTGSYLQIESPTDKGSHGDVLDMPVIDEAFAREGDLVEQAVDTASVTRRSPQLYVVSTAGNGRSFYLWNKVRAGRQAVEANDDSRVCYLEWSLPDDVAFDDEDAWWTYLPALGHTITIARLRVKLEKALRNELDEGADDDEEPGIDGFRRGYLNQWVDIPTGRTDGKPVKLPAEAWRATGITAERALRDFPGRAVTVAFDVSKDGEWASVSTGAGSIQGPYVETIEHRKGVGWLPQFLVERVHRNEPIAVGCNGAGPAGAQVGAILLAFAEADPPIPATMLRQLGAGEFKQACGGFYTDVVEGRLKRPTEGQGPLVLAAGDATERPLSGGWVWDVRDVTVPISPLTSATIARALLPTSKPKLPPKPARAYSF